jgi:hypothetical protein
MTTTSEASFAFIPAVTFGVTPATPAFKNLRFTSESFAPQFDTKISDEIRADATIREIRRSGLTAAGDLNFELHRSANLEEVMAAALRGTWATNTLKAGTQTPSFTLERKIEMGATDYYHRFEGTRFSGMSLSVAPEEFVTGSMKAMSAGHTVASTIVTGATYPTVVGVDGPPMVGVDVSTLQISALTGIDFLGMTFEVDNNLRMQRKIGQLAARGIGYGRRQITGTLQCYFVDLTAYNLLMNDTVSSIVATVSDGTNSFTFTFPRIRFTGGEVPNGGNDQDFQLTLNWQATYDSTLATDMQVTRV